LETAIKLLGHVAVFTVLALVLLVAANVLLRYFFREGSVWSQELEWHLLAPIAMLGIPYTLMMGDCVRVDLLYERFSNRTRLVLDIAVGAVGIAVALLLLKFSIPYVEKSWIDGEGSPDPGGLPARYILKAILPIGFIALFLQQVAFLIRSVSRLVGPGAPASANIWPD
jgi:TRAP-type mannitol/chloroaromatic compound transport system permease small subunit